MDHLTSAVSAVGSELAKMREENEFLKKKMTGMYSFDEVREVYMDGLMRHKPRKARPFLGTSACLRYRFDIICGKLKRPNDNLD